MKIENEQKTGLIRIFYCFDTCIIDGTK